MNRATSATGWVRNPDGTPGYTWNPITGCRNHTNGLCKGGGFPCYAYRLANGRLRERYLANDNIAGDQSPYKENVLTHLNDPFYPRFWSERLLQAEAKGKVAGKGTFLYYGSDKGIFVCDMSDLFGIGIPEKWTESVITVISSQPQHRFYLLTKQPQNLAKFSPFPDNCWVGVTATDNAMVGEGSEHLRHIEAKVKYLSLEPLLGKIWGIAPKLIGIDWVIIGAQTKPYKPPEFEWAEDIVRACGKGGVPIFMKDNLRPLLESKTNNLMLFNRDKLIWELRQEMPK